MEQRLQKILSNYGIASRRKAEQMILERRVRVNGNTASLGDVADDEEDVIEVDGVRLKKQPERVVLMLNKPRGYVCTLSDEKGRKTSPSWYPAAARGCIRWEDSTSTPRGCCF
ncbi:MAG: S4 domain-containing protein [Oscillospiraceae bacterium]